MFQALKEIFLSLNGKTARAIAVLICLIGIAYFYGCEAKAPSLNDPARKVSRAELEAEIAYFNARAEARIAELDNQDKLKKLLLDQASIIASGGAFNPVGAINSIVSIMAVGYAVDARRKLASVNKKNAPATT
jgi:hypothetical protein